MQRHARALMYLQIGIDFILINAAFLLAYLIRYELRFPITVAEANYVAYTEYIPISLMLATGLLAIYRIEGIYNYVRGRSWLEELLQSTHRDLHGHCHSRFHLFLFSSPVLLAPHLYLCGHSHCHFFDACPSGYSNGAWLFAHARDWG